MNPHDGQYDAMVIGGGAAGLSAALVLSRARRKVLVVDAGAPRNGPATHMHGFLSRDGMPPAELLAAGRREVSGYGGEIVEGTVSDLVPDGRSGFWVLFAGKRISARCLLITTGLRDELPDIRRIRERWARDVLHCPYCHGHEVRDRQLGVLGGTAGAVRYAQIVRQWTHDLVYFTPPDTLTAVERTELLARAIGVVEGAIEELVIDDADRLRGVQMRDGCVVLRDALFVPPRFVPNNTLLVGLGCDVDADGWVTVDSTGRTSVPGVWAAGNVVDPRAQVITAAGAGSAAAIAVNADLVEDDVRNAVRDLDHGLLPRLATNIHPKDSA
jgi:thioredoxin reductase